MISHSESSSEDSSSEDDEEDSSLVISIGSSGFSSRLVWGSTLLPDVSLAPLVRHLTLLPRIRLPMKMRMMQTHYLR